MKYTEELNILWDLIRYADTHVNFDGKYIEDINDFFYKHEYITKNQLDILKRIYLENDIKEFIETHYGYRD